MSHCQDQCCCRSLQADYNDQDGNSWNILTQNTLNNIIYQKNLLKNIKFKNNELICELIDKKDISQQLFNSFGIHFRLYNINLKDQTKYKLSFKMKSLNEHTISKKPKIFTGIKWITSDIGLKKEYQLFEFIEELIMSRKVI